MGDVVLQLITVSCLEPDPPAHRGRFLISVHTLLPALIIAVTSGWVWQEACVVSDADPRRSEPCSGLEPRTHRPGRGQRAARLHWGSHVSRQSVSSVMPSLARNFLAVYRDPCAIQGLGLAVHG